MKNYLQTIFPFLRWFPMGAGSIRADLLAGITVALILVPQSMAYAQLAGLPVVYGLYASFIPVIIASMWGSSSQLHTGPVAMLSIMSAAAVIPFATPGSASFIEISIMLALMVGILRLALGIFKLGAIVNVLSSPVIVGFTNAAALIIGLSQLNKVLGVPFPRTDSYLADLLRVLQQIPDLHIGTFIFAAGAWIFIDILKRKAPSLPGILLAVAVSTIVSALVSFENKISVDHNDIKDTFTLEVIDDFSVTNARIDELINEIAELKRDAHALEEEGGLDQFEQATEKLAHATVLNRTLQKLKAENTNRQVDLHAFEFYVTDIEKKPLIYTETTLPSNAPIDDRTWRFSGTKDGKVVFSSGGAVVGDIPQGLPSFNAPTIEMDLVLALIPAALVMALIGFMEATSISKAIASSTGEKIQPSKELIGQGLANIAGSFFSSFTVSGSFSRSAVAAKSGAKTGLFAIISALAVVLVLLFFTPYLYHLPQAVLAVIVMMAVFSLIKIKPLTQAWKINKIEAIIGISTFVATLAMAPAIANGILFGVSLTVIYFLITSMRPRTEIVSIKPDGTLGGMKTHGLEPLSQCYVPVRFDGSLNFINVAYFEDMILEAERKFPHAEHILVIGSGINDMDASGEEKVRELADRLSDLGVQLIFSGLKHQVLEAFKDSSLIKEMGEDSFFPDKKTALEYLAAQHPDCAERTKMAIQGQ